MARVTSKLQVTIPKAVADRYRIRPGTDIVFEPAGDTIRVTIARRVAPSARDRARLLARMIDRQAQRERGMKLGSATSRGWTRDELYDRVRSR